jgi:catechol 2,3-dioxygenase-like lactoylglutathione lyase family enzyme
MPANPSLTLTILYVKDLTRARAFYDSVFGCVKTVDEPVYVEYAVGPGIRIGLMPQTHTRSFLGEELGGRRFADGTPRAELYLRFESAAEILERLEIAGGRCVSPLSDRDWGDRAAYYLDLDGYVLAIAEPLN